MRAIAGICHSITSPGTRTAWRYIAAAILASILAASGHARAEGITLVQSDAVTQMATETLSQGVMVPFAWEQRVALVGLGVAGLYLGASTETARRSPSSAVHSAVRSATYRLALPLAGAALGSLVACDSLCDGLTMTAEPLVGAMAGALVAHVVDRDTGSRPQDRASGDVTPGLVWTPTVSVGVGSYSIGVMGRF